MDIVLPSETEKPEERTPEAIRNVSWARDYLGRLGERPKMPRMYFSLWKAVRNFAGYFLLIVLCVYAYNKMVGNLIRFYPAWLCVGAALLMAIISCVRYCVRKANTTNLQRTWDNAVVSCAHELRKHGFSPSAGGVHSEFYRLYRYVRCVDVGEFQQEYRNRLREILPWSALQLKVADDLVRVREVESSADLNARHLVASLERLIEIRKGQSGTEEEVALLRARRQEVARMFDIVLPPEVKQPV